MQRSNKYANYAWLALLIGIWGTCMTVLSLTRLYEFKTSIMDLACYVQTFWNFSQRGQFLLSLPQPFYEHHVFGQHFTPFFYLIYPIYALFPYAETFLMLQVWLLALAGIGIWRASIALGTDERIALLWVAVYLFNPFTLSAAVWDFHEVCFAAFVMSWMLWAIAVKNRTGLLIFSLLLLGTKEHFGLAVFGAGLLWAQQTRQFKFGIGLSLFGLVALAAAILIAVPHFHPLGVHPMLLNAHDESIDRFGWLSQPAAHAALLWKLAKDAFFYLVFFLATTLFLPLLAPLWLLPGLADLTANLLSGNPMPRSVNAYHSVPLVPVFVIAAIKGAHCAQRFSRFSRKELAGFTLIASLASGWVFAPAPWPGSSNVWELGAPRLDYISSDKTAIAEIQQLIDPAASIGTQANLGTIFAKHRQLYAYPFVRDKFDMLILRLDFPLRYSPSVFNIPIREQEADTLYAGYRTLMQQDWKIIYWNAPWLVIARHSTVSLAVEAEVEAQWQRFMAQSKMSQPHAP